MGLVPQRFPQLSGDHLELHPLLSSRPGRMRAGYICQSNVGVFLQPGWEEKAPRPSLGILRPIGGAASEASHCMLGETCGRSSLPGT